MPKSIVVFLLAVIAAIPSLPALAAPITIPVGLNPGDHYRVAFVTSTTTTAASSSIADYNALVTTTANSSGPLAALGTTWTAIASTLAVNAEDNTNTNPAFSAGVPVYNLAGSLVAPNNSVLWGATFTTFLSDRVDITETGATYTNLVWTGTHEFGVGAGIYTLGSGNSVYYAGLAGDSSRNWMAYSGIGPTSLLFPLYGLSGVLTVPVPEPSSMVLACLAAAGLVLASLRRRRN